MNDDQRLLANAYLDDEVTAEERARAEADAEVVAELVRLRAIRDAIRVTERPDAARRDAAIVAALDAFEVRPAATIATTPDVPAAPPASLEARRRSRWLGPLAAAVAAVVVIAGGVVVLRGGSQDDGDDAALSSDAADELTAMATQPEVAGGGGSDTADTAAPADTEAAAVEATAVAPAEQAAPDAGGEGTALLTSPDDLADFAAEASSTTARTSAESTFGCALGEWVGSATYQRDGQAVTVDVFVDDGEAIAADAATCEVVARAQLP